MSRRIRGPLPACAARLRVLALVLILAFVLLPLGHSSAHAALNTEADAAFETVVANMAGVRPVVESQLLAVDLGAEWLKTAVWRVETVPTGAQSGPSTASTAGVQLVLNDQSHRKSAPCVAFRHFPSANGTYARERVFAASAAALEPRFPLQVVCNPSILLGHPWLSEEEEEGTTTTTTTSNSSSSSHPQRDPTAFSNPIVRAPAGASITSTTGVRDALGVSIPSPQGAGSADTYSAEELVAMILGYAKRTAEKADADVNHLTAAEEAFLEASGAAPDAAHSALRHAVLTVPTFASLAQRQAMVDAAAMAGLRVVRLVHAASAAAVQLAQLRADQLFPAPSVNTVYVLIYDMGSRQTEAAIYAFTATTRHGVRRVTDITLKALAADHTLGGKAFDRCIADYWDATFLHNRVFGSPADASSATKEDAAAARVAQRKEQVSLLRAAQRAREVLSVNREAVVTVEGVAAPDPRGATGVGSGPFTTVLSRETFNEQCAPLFAKAVRVRDEAAEALARVLQRDADPGVVAQPMSVVDHLEVIGGATRMPRLLDVLGGGSAKAGVGRRLNGDEAPVLGAVHLGAQSAHLYVPDVVRVSEWLTNDIGFTLYTTTPEEEQEEEGGANVTLLFPQRTTMLPAVKSVRLGAPRYTSGDFFFEFVSPLGVATASSGYRQTYSVQGVAAALARAHEYERLATFKAAVVRQATALVQSEVVVETVVSESGLPSVRKAYLRAVFNKTTTALPDAPPPAEEKETAAQHKSTNEDASQDVDEEVVTEEDAWADPEESRDAGDATPPTTTTAAATTNTTSKRLVRLFDLTIVPVDTPPAAAAAPATGSPATARARSLNVGHAELVKSKATLAALQRQDDLRWLRSALSNDIETIVLHAKSSDAWESAVAQEEAWAAVVQDVSLWLEDYGESASIDELKARKSMVSNLPLPK